MSSYVPAWGGYEPDLPKAKDNGHRCEGSLPEAAYGKAIEYCYEDVDGKLWITNEEYVRRRRDGERLPADALWRACQVNFCPYCGREAKMRVEKIV